MNINLTLFAQAVSFAVFIWFTARFIWPPLLRAMEARQKTIAEGLAAAEKGRRELELSSQRATEAMREARERAQEVIGHAEKRAAQIVDEAKQAAKVEGERLVAAAKGEIEQESARAREQLREQVALIAMAGAERILRREVDAKAHANLLAELKREF
jgi:F-type H+-transporting ATPase subunit b